MQPSDPWTFLSKMSPVISPLDQLNSNTVAARDSEVMKSTPNTAGDSKSLEVARKRKVTFFDTPIQENEQNENAPNEADGSEYSSPTQVENLP